MLNLKKVLVVLSPDQEQQPALDKVIALAKLADFEITLISVEYTQYLVEGYYFDAIDLPRLRSELLEERKVTLDTLAQPLRDNGLSVETVTRWGHPAYETVIREAMARDCDLVIQHTRQHSAVSRLFLSHNDWQLVRCCPVPLLLVKEAAWQASPVILAAVDPKHARHKPRGLDHTILGIGTDLATLTGGALYAVHSYSQLPVPEARQAAVKAEHQAAFDTLVADFDLPADHCILTEEAPDFALDQIQQQLKADIVVMGAISRSILSEVFIGSTTEKVLDFLECDVMIVKPEGFTSPVTLPS